MELNLEEFTGLLFRDIKSNYNPNNIHKDKLFFSTDTKELLLNGESYGKNNLFVLNDIGLLSNESGQRIKEIIGSFKDVTQAIIDRKVFITIMDSGITPVIVKQQSVKVSFTIFYYDTYNTSQIKHRTIIINSDGIEWTNIESIIDNEIIKISDLNLNYNRENKIIAIKKENNDIITQIDATDFIKDGMINTVELIENPDGRPVGTYLVITFNTDAGKEPIYLDITKLIGVYTAGQGIDILDNTISIKIDPSSEKYLVVTEDGLKIVGIDEKFNFTSTTKINKLIGEIQITNELEHDKQELFDLFGVDNVNSLFSLSPDATVKYFEDVEGNILNYVVNGGISAGLIDLSYKDILFDGRILQGSISVLGRKDSHGIYTAISSITETKSENDLVFSNHIEWGSSSNMNNYTNPGIYFLDGIHSNSGDNLPIKAYANGAVSGMFIVTYTSTDGVGSVIGQTLTLSNRVGGETKHYIRNKISTNETEYWTPWKEVNTIQMFGEKSSGIATRANIDAAIDNGQYAGVYMDTDGFLPQGATFTLTVVNNYAANAASSLPSTNRQITQIFTYTPLSLTGTINKSNIVKRDGIGGSTITWGELENVTDNPIYYVGDIFSLSTSSTSAEIEKVLGSVNDFTNAYKKGKLIVCRTNISENNNNSTISPILFQYYENSIKIKMIYAGLGYNPSSPDDCIEIMLNKNSNTWRVTNVIKQKLNDYSDIQNKVNTLENECNELQSLKSTGILWSNLFVGADMEKGYNEDNIPGFSTYPSLGGTIERVLDSETSRYCIKGYFPEGTNFSSFIHPQLFTDINFVGENTTQEFSISFRYKCTSNLQNIHLLCNNTFMEYTDINGSSIRMPLIKDNNWHYLHVIAKKSGVTNKNYTIGLYIYFAAEESNTLTSDLEFYITDIVISTSKFPDYAVVRNVNDYITPVNKETIKPIVNEIINEYPDIHNCVFMSLGDSITTEGYYIGKLRQLISPSKYYNLAVIGAHWADYVNTIYDGNPVFGGDNINNTLGNQVQKIINNPDIYNTAPDVIIIAAGTNDTTPITADKTEYEMKVEIDSHFNENSTTPIQVTEPTFDESDTYKEHRRTIAGAMRYCILKLQSLYPNAKIYILTPIQGSYNPNKDYLTQLEIKQRYIAEVAKHLSIPVIHVGEECGINRDFEYGGTYWKEEWDPNNNKTGRDLVDGLHPNTNGSWKMAKYIYNKLKNDYIK